jgi:hypothetical protein
MKREKGERISRNQPSDLRKRAGKTGSDAGEITVPQSHEAGSFGQNPFFQRYALTIIIFLFSLFFILTITSPGIYMNDEWITANQLHQLDIGHQVIFSEAKYGVTKEGTVSAYFIYRQNLLTYSLALPLSALPLVKLFGLLGDNFRLIIILIWSLCLVLIALLLDTCYPAYARFRGIRLLFPALLLSLFLFLVNILLYKQFPFSAPDAPFEVAALVLANSLFFALLVTIVFETCRLILKKSWMALFGTFAIIASSSYIFWAGTAKDHILTTVVLALVIYFFVRYLSYGRNRDALFSFICSGLLIWIRPEVGFFVTIFTGLFFCIPLIRNVMQKGSDTPRFFTSLLPLGGVFLGGIPFFINNYLISHNWLIPVNDLQRDIELTGNASALPLPRAEIIVDPTVINQTGGLDLTGSFIRAGNAILHQILPGLTLENSLGFLGVLFFPANGSIGFFIMCPLAVIGLAAIVLWNKRILTGEEKGKEIFFFLIVIIVAIFFSYFGRFSSLNISLGVIPDMRYLSPAYVPCGLLSIMILAKMDVLKQSDEKLQSLLKYSIGGIILLLPVMFFIMLVIQPFGNDYPGYAALFKYSVLFTLVLCLGAMILSRVFSDTDRFFFHLIPYLLVLVIITVFSFQIMLTSFYGLFVKINGYPLWIPLIREGVGLFMEVRYIPPV